MYLQVCLVRVSESATVLEPSTRPWVKRKFRIEFVVTSDFYELSYRRLLEQLCIGVNQANRKRKNTLGRCMPRLHNINDNTINQMNTLCVAKLFAYRKMKRGLLMPCRRPKASKCAGSGVSDVKEHTARFAVALQAQGVPRLESALQNRLRPIASNINGTHGGNQGRQQ